MRVLICGGRKYDDKDQFDRALAALRLPSETVIIHGAAPGADRFAQEWADDHSIAVVPYPAFWTDLSQPGAVIRKHTDGKEYDAMAGHHRNQRMIDEGVPDLVVAFLGGTGTADMVRRARIAGIMVFLVR